jgi:hypothetical protein
VAFGAEQEENKGRSRSRVRKRRRRTGRESAELLKWTRNEATRTSKKQRVA